MIKNIIREVAPEACEFSFYFDNDGFKEAAGDYCYNLFIIGDNRRTACFNEKEYEDIQYRIDHILDRFQDVEDKNQNGYATYKEVMQDWYIDYTPHKCHALKEWAKNADVYSMETVADFLTITTGKKWRTMGVTGYSQGDCVDVLYCEGFHSDEVAEACGEIWLGCAKEFCVLDVEDYAEDEDGEATYTETDSCYGYIIADCQAWKDEDYKRLVCEWAGINEEETRLEMIDGSTTQTIYSYRAA